MDTLQGQGGRGIKTTHVMKEGWRSALTPDHEAQDDGSH